MCIPSPGKHQAYPPPHTHTSKVIFNSHTSSMQSYNVYSRSAVFQKTSGLFLLQDKKKGSSTEWRLRYLVILYTTVGAGCRIWCGVFDVLSVFIGVQTSKCGGVRVVRMTGGAGVAVQVMGLTVVNVGGLDIIDGNRKMTLAIMWQLMRRHTLNLLQASEEQRKAKSKRLRESFTSTC